MNKVTISIIDDHPLMVQGISHSLKQRSGFSITSSGSSSVDITRIMTECCPNLMIIDLSMSGDAFQAIEDATHIAPNMKIIVFTASNSTDHAIRALEAGASAYVLKGSSADELIEAIDAVLEGSVYVTPLFMSKVLSTLHNRASQRKEFQNTNLSARESQVIKLLLGGKKNKEIATALSLSEKTIKNYMTHLMQKLHVRNRLEAVIAAQKMTTVVSDAQGLLQ